MSFANGCRQPEVRWHTEKTIENRVYADSVDSQFPTIPDTSLHLTSTTR
jgi:hypothetical protein